ncbi:MAG: hypothetical protein RBT55_04950 [Rhodocyclaceae bacterium]|nr:hypothetical protein [Rhodocyclaceae bacterium]
MTDAARRPPCSPCSPCPQSGIVLPVALVVMLLMSLLALSALNESIIDEKVLISVREHQIAQQLAETALRAGEETADALRTTADLTRLSAQAHTLPADHLPSVGQAEYRIQHLGPVERARVTGFSAPAGAALHEFRISAQGIAADGRAEVLLESRFRKRLVIHSP